MYEFGVTFQLQETCFYTSRICPLSFVPSRQASSLYRSRKRQTKVNFFGQTFFFQSYYCSIMSSLKNACTEVSRLCIYSRYFSCRTSNILLLISQQYYTYVYTCFLSGMHVGFTLLRADNPSKTQGLSTSIRWAVTLIAVIHQFLWLRSLKPIADLWRKRHTTTVKSLISH